MGLGRGDGGNWGRMACPVSDQPQSQKSDRLILVIRNLPHTLTPGQELQSKRKRWPPLPMTHIICMIEESKEKSMIIFLCW